MASTEDQCPKLLHFDNADVITVLVGANETKFIIHQNIIISCSEFFRAACAGKFKEAKEKLVRLPDIEPEIFKIYATWIYTKSLVLGGPDAVPKNLDSHEGTIQAVKIFIAGDVLGDVRLRNAAIDYLFATMHENDVLPDPTVVSLVYEHTPENSTLRKLMMHEHLYRGSRDAERFKSNATNFPKQFLADLVTAWMLGDWIKSKARNVVDRCRYHEHNDEVPKCLKRKAPTLDQGDEKQPKKLGVPRK